MTSTHRHQRLGVELYPHDRVVVRGKGEYVIRAVKPTESFVGGSGGGSLDFSVGGLVALLVWIVGAGLWQVVAVDRLHRWKVGVVRLPTGRWAVGAAGVVHKERLPRGADPEVEVSRLLRRVEAGDFDDVRARRWRPTTYASCAGARISPAGRSGTTR